MVASVRTVRWLCWALVVLAIISALFTVFFTFGIVVPPPPPELDDLVEQIDANRLGDQAIFPYVFIQSLATIGVFLIAAVLGTLLRGWTSASSLRDTMVLLFVVGGILGIVANVINIAVSNAATFGYCDCGYKPEELIAQDKALTVGWELVNWLSLTAVTLVGVGVAIAGRLLDVSPAWRTLSYVIAALLLIAAAIRAISAFVFISAFDPFQVTDLLVALAAGILVPIWAILLARGLGSRTTGASNSEADLATA